MHIKVVSLFRLSGHSLTKLTNKVGHKLENVCTYKSSSVYQDFVSLFLGFTSEQSKLKLHCFSSFAFSIDDVRVSITLFYYFTSRIVEASFLHTNCHELSRFFGHFLEQLSTKKEVERCRIVMHLLHDTSFFCSSCWVKSWQSLFEAFTATHFTFHSIDLLTFVACCRSVCLICIHWWRNYAWEEVLSRQEWRLSSHFKTRTKEPFNWTSLLFPSTCRPSLLFQLSYGRATDNNKHIIANAKSKWKRLMTWSLKSKMRSASIRCVTIRKLQKKEEK